MGSGMKKKELLELKTDIKLLLECLEYQKEDSAALKQALMTLSSIVQTSGEAKDVFRDIGGIEQILTVATSHRKEEVVETALYCLGSAVERNVYSQKLLTTASIFTFLHGILLSPNKMSVRKKQTASFLALVLVSNNGFGQNLVRQSSCLHDILTLIRTTLPLNMKALDSEWLEEMDGRSLDLWATLLSTACACVNNPLNDENQRICASLLPYLFSVLTKQSDDRIIKPILSLIGLTVSGNVSNQDRVRKCGGMKIFVDKLDSLKSSAVTDVTAKSTAVQLLCTVDACISDNDLNSKQFGDFGGIKLVLEMFSECCMGVSDKTQAALTLAHAVDAYNSNQRHITGNGGIAVLIQQMTETQDEELSKTIRYLLHICVSSGKPTVMDKDTYLNEAEQLISKMESMKRHNDTQMLQKINELDAKLKSMEERSVNLDREGPITQSLSDFDRFSSHRKTVQSQERLERPTSKSGSHIDNTNLCQQDCPTPRERSLLEQLIKEKAEKERLEKLNHMLQENICRSFSTLTSSLAQPGNTISAPSESEETENAKASTNVPSHSLRIGVRPNSKYNSNATLTAEKIINEMSQKYGSHCISVDDRDCSVMLTEQERNCSSVLFKDLTVAADANNNICGQSISSEISASEANDARTNDSNRSQYSANSYCFNTINPKNVQNLSMCNVAVPAHSSTPYGYISTDVSSTETNLNASHNKNGQLYSASPLNLSTKCIQKPFIQENTVVVKGLNANQGSLSGRHGDITMTNTTVEKMEIRKPKMNRHAEIQCGTPMCARPEEPCNINNNNNLPTNEGSSQKEYLKTPKYQSQNSARCVSTKDRRFLIMKSEAGICKDASKKEIDIETNLESSITQTPVIVLTDCRTEISTDRSDKHGKIEKSSSRNDAVCRYDISTNTNDTRSCLTQHLTPKTKSDTFLKSSPGSAVSKNSNTVFVKPVAIPPKSKVRVTPLLGSNKFQVSALKCLNKPADSNNNAAERDSDVQSEFDMVLLKNVNIKPWKVKQTPVIKSQNNVRKIDRVVEKREGNAAVNWVLNPSTPKYQQIIPPRPAYSDCGIRRNVFKSEDNGTSFERRRSIDDSDIHSHSPTEHGALHTSLESSPVDSNIEGYRSNSDVSEDEDVQPNISAAVLRSGKIYAKGDNSKCPGCNGFYNPGEGLELNSRTYNIALETDPNTCQTHRKLRQVERSYVRERRSTRLENKLKMNLNQDVKKTERRKSNKKRKQNQSVFDFSSNSDPEISPLSDENVDRSIEPPPRSKRRRQRVPYSAQEERNLEEGVRKLGKHWNQILNTYDFHHSRTNVDLMDKYKRMKANKEGVSTRSMAAAMRNHKPFSMCEERRLRRGILKFGYNWKTILKSFTFTQGRTTEDLRNKWRTLHKKSGER